jgi:hypothetical protein
MCARVCSFACTGPCRRQWGLLLGLASEASGHWWLDRERRDDHFHGVCVRLGSHVPKPFFLAGTSGSGIVWVQVMDRGGYGWPRFTRPMHRHEDRVSAAVCVCSNHWII